MPNGYSTSFQSELRSAVDAARGHLGPTFTVNANRAKAYYEIATVLRREAGRTGSDRLFQAAKQLEEQAEITTYSGPNGGAALIGNYAAFVNRPDLYNVPLDLFSWQIDDAVVNFFDNVLRSPATDPFSAISDKNIVAVDGLVWASKGLIDYFPGTALGIDYSGIPTTSPVWDSIPQDLRSQLSGRSFDRFTYAAAGGITVAASFANPVAASLGGTIASFGFSAQQVAGLASSSSVANERYRLTKDEFGRVVIETLGTSGDVLGLFVYTSNGLDLASPLDNFLAAGAAAFAPPGYIMEFVDQIPVLGDGTPLYQVRNIGGNYGFDLLKDRLGANFGNGGLRLRNNDVPGNTYFRPGDDTNLTASELFDFFSTSRTAYLDGDQRFYVAPQTSLVVDGIVKTGIVIGSSNSSGSSFYFQTYEKGPSGDKVTSVVRVEADSSGNIVSASISDEEATRALNLAEGARIRNLLLENAAGAAKNADNFESGKELSSLKDSIAVNVQGIQIEGDNQAGAGLQTISLLRPDSSSIPQVDPATGAILPGRLHRAPSLVSNPLNPNDGTVVFDQRGRVVDVDTALVNGVPTVVRTRASDGFYTGSDGLFKAGVTVETTYSNGRPVDTNIKINNNPVGIEFSQAGAILGQQLGYRLAKGNVLVGIVSSATLQTIGDNLGDVFDGLVGRQSVENATKDAFATFGDEFLANLQSAGLGAISSFLTAELINALGVDGFAGELANTTGGVVIGQIVTNIANGVANPLAGVGGGASLVSAVGSFLGTKLANEISSFGSIGSIGGQIGSALGTAAAGIINGPVLIAAVATGNPVIIGAAVIALVIDTVILNLIGGLIGSVFGGTPRSGADASWDEASGKFVVANVYSKKGGSKDAARSVAGAVADTFNAVLEAAGGTLLDPEAVQSGNYGMRKSDFVYRPVSTRDKDAITQRFSGADAATKLIGYGVVQGLTDPDFRIAGGDVYVKRALYNTFAAGVDARNFDVATITGNIASAQAYERYLANASVIGALVKAEPNSVFATETLITLVRADELGLTRRAASDCYGGFSFLLKEAGAGAADVSANDNEVVQYVAA